MGRRKEGGSVKHGHNRNHRGPAIRDGHIRAMVRDSLRADRDTRRLTLSECKAVAERAIALGLLKLPTP